MLAALVLAGLVWLGVMVLVLPRILGSGEDGPRSTSGNPFVGGDLHAVSLIGERLFVSGHDGAASREGPAGWRPIPSLASKDAMAWANTTRGILVGGHEGLYRSTDGGRTFSRVQTGVPATDVHAVGAAGSRAYLASPETGLHVSDDAGRTWRLVSRAGTSLMGTMLVDPENADHVIAPAMQAGVVESRDGGRTWRALGGVRGAMSVAWSPRDRQHLIAVGAAGAAASRDGGDSWTRLDVPEGTSAVAVRPDGAYLAAVHEGRTAVIYVSRDGGRSWSPA